MQIEYFRLIDRIIALDLAARTIQVEANVPTESTIFEGHFPGHPLMPGVLLLETMAQASGWLVIGVTKFTCMPFFAAVKEAKFRSFVTPGMALTVNAAIEHEGSGFAVTRAEIRSAGQAASATPRSPSVWFRSRARISATAWKRSQPPSRFRWSRPPMADAGRETWITGIGIVSCLGEGADAHWQRLNEPPRAPDTEAFAPYSVHRLAPIELDKQIPKKGDQRQMEPWQRIGHLCGGPCARQRRRQGQCRAAGTHGHDRRRRRRRARRGGRHGDPHRARQGGATREPSSTSG